MDLRNRGIIKPIRNYIEDWMHGWVSGGQANTHTCLLLHALKDRSIQPSIVCEAVKQFKLPSKHGKVSDEWVKQARLSKQDKGSFSSFAGVVLTVVLLIFAFLMDDVYSSPDVGDLVDHIRCFGVLVSILALFQRPADIMSNAATLKI